DVGCGAGRVTLALARAYPEAQCVGVDLDAASIALAEEAARAEGLGERVRFHAHGVERLPPDEPFDLITACDTVHDFAAPLETLTAIRERLTPDGVFFLVEPNVGDTVAENRNPVAVMFYGFSLLHCMSQSLANGGPGLGACLGPARTEALLRDASFTRCETVPIKSQVNRFYAARP
nr:class I SAM-dependent methyltransferase [Gammaproteobacteria bacterium]NIR84721.1 class I SAM-dependent methyltransferase [Gammaproteobacteria bacterium]NIU05765.1 class I SAM-dependent methyltransferase [Gammaproteobacteria bacterium]NIV75983.1 methyltransferase domain-containing protein [Gammaproteobacteria bacterium]NIX87038.1 methyltransferase domain-containing protein [Gammaproteobacteria bacterium]